MAPIWGYPRVVFCVSRNCPLYAEVRAGAAKAPGAEFAATECRDSNAADVLMCLLAAEAGRGVRVVLVSNDRLLHTLARIRTERHPGSATAAVSDLESIDCQLRL